MAKPEFIFVKSTLGKDYKGGTYYRNSRFYYRPIGLHLDTENLIIKEINNPGKRITETCRRNTD